ncbi:flagellar biosynthetic protein FliR [Brevibacillus marinus]|uniref:flagellar biosynthetic protein FliR n=1 Tax=Brevibacillus marinus TaxID=2496837 RepID=UPI001F497DA2|nr:flagellar biosynthetic protein FliR [Brevibacillus marinus]
MQQWIMQYLPVFLLVFVRMTAFMVTVPVFAARGVPNQVKVGLSFFAAFLSFSYIPQTAPIPLDLAFALHAVKEALVGIMLGLVLQIVFFAVQVAGGLIDMQNGFALANVIDPRTGAYVPLTGNFKNILATLYFLSIDGHHMLIRGIITSYQAVPIDLQWGPLGSEALFLLVVKVFGYMFMSAFLIAAPVVVALFLVDLSLGIIAKSVPQFNIFVVGLPIKIFASFLVLLVVMPGFLVVLSELFKNMFLAMSEMMTILGGQR